MRHLSALAVATAALAGAAQAQAQTGSPVVRPLPTADGAAAAWRKLSWPAKTAQPEAPAVLSRAVETPAAAPAAVRRVNNRYSARSVAPVSTRAASTTILRSATPASIYDAPAAAPARTAAAPVTPARVQPEAFASRPFARDLQRPTTSVPAYYEAAPAPAPQPAPVAAAPVAAPTSYEAPIRTTRPVAAPVTSPAIDPEWVVREDLMRQPPAPVRVVAAPKAAPAQPAAPAPAPVAAATATPKAAPLATVITKPAAPVVAAPVKTAAKTEASPKAVTAAPIAPAAVTAEAPKEPWRRLTTDGGPRFYSVHRQFGYTPDPTRPTLAPTGAASADPLPSAFFLAGALAEDTDDTAATEERQTQVLAKKDDKKSRRRK